MKVVCPTCQEQFPLSAGLLDAEAKRFGIALAGVDAIVGRSLVSYIALHKPEKTALRLAKAAKIAEEISALVASGEVRRNGIARRATSQMWAQAMDQMTDQRAKLRLPLSGHGYLLEIVAGLADSADADAERKKEAQIRVGNRRHAEPEKADPLGEKLAFLKTQLEYGALTQEEYDAKVAATKQEHGSR